MPADFVDSNVILYIVSEEPAKQARAEDLLRSRPFISVQVLNEVVNVLRRKLRTAWPDVDVLLGQIRAYVEIVPVTIAVHERGLRLLRSHNLATYDAMIVAAALEAGCATLWSEDMQDGLRVEDRLVIRNPFATG